MKRKKKTPESLIPATESVEVIPPDLKLKWDGVVAVATAFSCLDKGYFPHTYSAVVKTSLQFLSKLHENMVLEASDHPQSHMIPELKDFKKQNKAEAQNGEEKAAI